MQVSAILANKFTAFGNIEKPDVQTDSNDTAEPLYRTFTSTSQKRTSQINDFDNINEWKDFCHSQIITENLDYLA